MGNSSDTMKVRGSLCIFFSASLWGLFWIPLRHFDDVGVTSLWAVSLINMAAAMIAIPVALKFGKFDCSQIKWILIMGLGMAAANVFYFAGIILSDVIRVIFLFYLLPIWATLFSKLLFNVPVGMTRLVAIAFAIAGIWLLLGAGGWPVPQNIGDVFGILAGMFWALGLTLMRGKSELDAFVVSASALGLAFPMAAILGLTLSVISPEVQPPLPSFETVQIVILPILAFGILILWPTMVGQLWGAKFVASTTAALLTMSEIIVATLSVALLAVSNLPWIAWIGAGLITMAVLIDLLAGQKQTDEAVA